MCDHGRRRARPDLRFADAREKPEADLRTTPAFADLRRGTILAHRKPISERWRVEWRPDGQSVE
jgi:hypothetical protein